MLSSISILLFIFDYANRSAVSEDYKAFIEEFLKGVKEWFGGQDGMSTILNSLQMFEQN